MRLNQAQVNGGIDCDALKAAKCLVISLVTRVTGSHCPHPPCSETTAKGTSQGNGPGIISGEEDLVELDSGPTL